MPTQPEQEKVKADFAYYEFMATTRLGYTMKDFAHAYLWEITSKTKIYKTIFNIEKLGCYQTEEEMGTLEEL